MMHADSEYGKLSVQFKESDPKPLAIQSKESDPCNLSLTLSLLDLFHALCVSEFISTPATTL